jgi:phosphonate degradation associated HDIG domain protein
MNDPIEYLFDLLRERGGNAYFGEAVSETEHMLQTAALAERHSAPPTLITAALLHDIGHLLHGRGEGIAGQGVDARHEEVGADWLQTHFGPEVTEPVRLHVAAKRYLCHAEPGYFAGLSEASRRSLMLQGGPMEAAEAGAFVTTPYGERALSLRRWDDAAKVQGAATPPLEHFRAIVTAVLKT